MRLAACRRSQRRWPSLTCQPPRWLPHAQGLLPAAACMAGEEERGRRQGGRCVRGADSGGGAAVGTGCQHPHSQAAMLLGTQLPLDSFVLQIEALTAPLGQHTREGD